MSVVIASALLIGTLILSALPLMSSLVGTSFAQGDALGDMAETRGQRLRTSILVTSASTADGTTINVQATNNGSVSIVSKAAMDVIIEYTSAPGTEIAQRLTYNAVAAGANEWTMTSISPDVFNPGLWDPGEQAAFELQISPAMKTSSSASVVVVTPNGVDSPKGFSW